MKNENIIDISLKLNNYQEIFDPYDNRNENVRNINPEIIEAMTNIYKDTNLKQRILLLFMQENLLYG